MLRCGSRKWRPGSNGWNHNIHYTRSCWPRCPAGAQRALDVGCGAGMLARELRERVPDVVGLDLDEPSLNAARAADPGGRVRYVLGDFRDTGLRPQSLPTSSAA